MQCRKESSTEASRRSSLGRRTRAHLSFEALATLVVIALGFSLSACSEETRDRIRDLAESRSPTRTFTPSVSPSDRPTRSPRPTVEPTREQDPTEEPTRQPEPTEEPTREPEPTQEPTQEPTHEPEPTEEPAGEAQPSNIAAEPSPAESSAWPLLLFVLILAGVAIAVFAAVRKRHPSENPSGRDGGRA
jgi:type IV secretory pathway VirB10-like protein